MRAKNLKDQDIASIVSILDGWSGKLSWDLLIEAIEVRRLGCYTRQALHKHVRIREAFGLTKIRLANSSSIEKVSKELDPEMRVAFQLIERLEAEKLRLTLENNRLLEQFVCWAYNAHTRGLSKDFLNQPLPRVDREQSVRKTPANKLRGIK